MVKTMSRISAFLVLLYLCPGTVISADSQSTCEAGEQCEGDGEEGQKNHIYTRPQCQLHTQELGPYEVKVNLRDQKAVESGMTSVEKGGLWSPPDCEPRQKIAIIVPYRRRENDLPVFLDTMHPFLQKQRAHYGIYIIHQADEKHFNRGSLLNVGFAEAMKDEEYDCVILHDIDKWPEDTRNIYRCSPGTPTHMIGRQRHVGKDYRKRPYDKYFGGVTAISSQDFRAINGFSNYFWGWGSEDDDLLNRMKKHDLETSRVDDVIGSYVESYQPYGFVNPRRHQVVKEGMARYDTDGLNSLEYQVLHRIPERLFTNISVRLLHEDPYEED